MPTIKRIRTGVACICTVAACVATAAVLAQPQIRAFDPPDAPQSPGWGGVENQGATLFMRMTDPATISARNVDGAMVKAANLPHNVQVVQNIGSKTVLRIDHEQWGQSFIELNLPVTSEVWLQIQFDENGRADVNVINQNQLRLAADSPAAERASSLQCGDCDMPQETPGCSDPVCQDLVCTQDSFCCAVEWDMFCVNTALAKCDCGGTQDCAACPENAVVNDSQVGITGGFFQPCPMDGPEQWTSLAFPIQTGGGNFDTVISQHNTNTGEGDIYVTGGTCDGPDVNNILFECCCAILGEQPGVDNVTVAPAPFATSDVDPTWVIMVFRDSFSFDVAFDSSTNPTATAAYGNLSGIGDPGEWQDLNNFGFGACYFVDLDLTGGAPSDCECAGPPEPPANDLCVNAEPLVAGDCVDGTTINATVDPDECVTATTAPGVWYTVTGTGNGLRATTCEDFPPAGADYDTKISVFCGECGGVPASDCCIANGTPGCDDPECEATVCGQDPFCCATTWDTLCANQALTKCEVCLDTPGPICVDGNDDACTSEILHSTVEWCSVEGATYLILVHGFSSSTGNFTLCVTDDGTPCTPDVDCPIFCETDADCPPGLICEDGLCVAPPTGGCCQCDGPMQFCTQETAEDCAALEGEFLGLGAPCTSEGEVLVITSTPGLAIPDDSLPGITDDIVVGEAITVTDLDVDLIISHTWVGDLCVWLSKDGGTEIELIKRPGADLECDAASCCGCSADNYDIILDDEAADSIEDACEDGLTGTYSPAPGALAAFDGLDATGTWTIRVNDNAGGDTGTLVQWSLHFEVPATGLTPCEEAFPNQCCEPPIVECLSELVVGGGDDDLWDDSGGGCRVSVAWNAFSPTDCEIMVEAFIETECETIPIENGQLVNLNCFATPGGGWGDDDDDDAPGCGSSYWWGMLNINAESAVLVVNVIDEAGNTASCMQDLCALCPVGGGDDD